MKKRIRILTLFLTFSLLLTAAPITGLPSVTNASAAAAERQQDIQSVSITYPWSIYKTKEEEAVFIPLTALQIEVTYKDNTKELVPYSALSDENDLIIQGMDDSRRINLPYGKTTVKAQFKGIQTTITFTVENYPQVPVVPVKAQTDDYAWHKTALPVKLDYVDHWVDYGDELTLLFGVTENITNNEDYDSFEYRMIDVLYNNPAVNSNRLSTYIVSVNNEGKTTAESLNSFAAKYTSEGKGKNIFFDRIETIDGVDYYTFCYYDNGKNQFVLKTEDGLNFSFDRKLTYPKVNGFYVDEQGMRFSKDGKNWSPIRLPDLAPAEGKSVSYTFRYFAHGVMINQCYKKEFGGYSDFGRPYFDVNLKLYYTEDFAEYKQFDLPQNTGLKIGDRMNKNGTVFAFTFLFDKMGEEWSHLRCFVLDPTSGATRETFSYPHLFTDIQSFSFLYWNLAGGLHNGYIWFCDEAINAAAVIDAEKKEATKTIRFPFSYDQLNDSSRCWNDFYEAALFRVDGDKIYVTTDNYQTMVSFTLPTQISTDKIRRLILKGSDKMEVICTDAIYSVSSEILRIKNANCKAGNHTYTDWLTLEEASKTVEGTKRHICSVCGKTETRTIPRLTEETIPVTRLGTDVRRVISIDLAQNNTLEYALEVEPKNASPNQIVWSTDAPEIVTVSGKDGTALLTAKTIGETTLRAQTKDGKVTWFNMVSVTCSHSFTSRTLENGAVESVCAICGATESGADAPDISTAIEVNPENILCEGDTVEIDFIARNCAGLSGVKLQLTYDPNVLRLLPTDDPTGGIQISDVPVLAAANWETPGEITFGLTLSDSLEEDTLPFVSYHFEILDVTQTTTFVGVRILEHNGEEPQDMYGESRIHLQDDTLDIIETDVLAFAKIGMLAEDISERFGYEKILKSDGAPLANDEQIGSGMTLVKPDGVQLKIVIMGDNDGDGEIEVADARNALRQAVGLEHFNEWQTAASLIGNGDEVDVSDARMILRAAVGLENPDDWFIAML